MFCGLETFKTKRDFWQLLQLPFLQKWGERECSNRLYNKKENVVNNLILVLNGGLA
jgi:hypothetical protein